MQVGNCENDMENHKGNITISRAKKVPVVNMLKGCFDFLFFHLDSVVLIARRSQNPLYTKEEA